MVAKPTRESTPDLSLPVSSVMEPALAVRGLIFPGRGMVYNSLSTEGTPV